MGRFVSKHQYAPSTYTYGQNLRIRVDLPPDGSLPALPQTLWVGRGAQALRIDLSAVDRSETPWGRTALAGRSREVV